MRRCMPQSESDGKQALHRYNQLDTAHRANYSGISLGRNTVSGQKRSDKIDRPLCVRRWNVQPTGVTTMSNAAFNLLFQVRIWRLKEDTWNSRKDWCHTASVDRLLADVQLGAVQRFAAQIIAGER